MEVRAGHPSSRSDKSDALTALNRVACGDERLAEMEVSGYDTCAVIDVHDVAGEKEAVHERDDAPVRSSDRFSDGAAEIDTEVAAGNGAVEDSSRSELTGQH